MRNTLATLLTAATLAGCASQSSTSGVRTNLDYTPEARKHTTEANYKDAQNRDLTQKHDTYKLEGLVLHENAYFSMRNDRLNSGEREFYLIKRGENTRVIADGQTEIGMKPEWIYVPTLATNEKGEALHRLPLSTQGQYGVKATPAQVKSAGIQRGHFTEGQDALPFRLLTITLAKDEKGKPIEYFIPKVEKSRIEQEGTNILPFYAVPREGTIREIDEKTGQITLVSPQGIFLLQRTEKDMYDTRALFAPIKTPTPEPKDPVGEALEPKP